MTVKNPPSAAPSRSDWETRNAIAQIALTTPEEWRQRIEALGKLIAGYVEFMVETGHLGGTSAEVKDKAVAAFYEQMVVAERRLGRIQEGLRLE